MAEKKEGVLDNLDSATMKLVEIAINQQNIGDRRRKSKLTYSQMSSTIDEALDEGKKLQLEVLEEMGEKNKYVEQLKINPDEQIHDFLSDETGERQDTFKLRVQKIYKIARQYDKESKVREK